jgi:hypothetical protein
MFTMTQLTSLSVSHPTSPKLERPKLFNKRQSLREKRQARTVQERPASDSNVSYATYNELAASQNNASRSEYPEMPSDVPDWISRRAEASRAPPRSMHILLHQEEHWTDPPAYGGEAEMYELDAGDPFAHTTDGNEVPRTVPSEERIGEESEEDEELVKAIELSQQDGFLAPRRINTDGFDKEQIAEALNRSLNISH